MKRMIINILSNNLGKLFEMVLGFIIVPFLISKLTSTGYGVIILMESFIIFFEMAAVGLRSALARFVGLHISKGKDNEVNSYLANGQIILYIFTFLFSIVGVSLLLNISYLFSIPLSLQVHAQFVLLMLILGFAINVIFTPYWAILYAKQRFDLINIYSSAGSLCRFILILVFYSIFNSKLEYYGIIFLVSVIIERMLVFQSAKKIFSAFQINFKNVSYVKLRQMWQFMLSIIVNKVSELFYDTADTVIINRIYGSYSNAIYAVSLKSIGALKRLIQYSVTVLSPTFTELFSVDEIDKIKSLFCVFTKLSALISIPFCVLLAIFAREFVTFWVGQNFLTSVNILYFHIIAIVPVLVFSICISLTTAFGKVKIPGRMALLLGVIKIGVSILFALHFNMGLVGFALGTAISQTIQTAFFLPYYTSKIVKINFFKYYLAGFIKPVLLGLVWGAIIFYIKSFLHINLLYLLYSLPMFVIVYYTISYFIILNNNERVYLITLSKRISSKLITSKGIA
ncbi:MAG: oligosaccharide flippase family protein [Candidatus Jettenia caeni]|nr:MAG: oligosaccharide flippase family protein [Candidatus Jettenia caeni]